ncbi:hypothetical protein BKA64DRAFT_705453 [Cadophora sp. MPI-SDFR-AT-0126]|nr:hypothetical protein BKA64DRAFT_705453 [Leotiomycetes sp. MPI-SDFR-AT-0126]
MDGASQGNGFEMTRAGMENNLAPGVEIPQNVRESEKYGGGMDIGTEPEESHTPEFPLLGPILVVGGCGFIGSNLVRTLLDDPESGPITIISRTPQHNQHSGASYFTGSITDETRMRELLFKIQPRIIFHLASASPESPIKEQNTTNVRGTQILLKCASRLPFVKALVFTSSHEGVEIEPRNEELTEKTCKLLTEKSTATPHQKSKGIADALVLAANGENLRTAVLRLPPVYGEGDPRLIPSILGMMRQGKQNMQIGPDKHVFEHVYVGNAVLAHVLCGKALLASSSNSISASLDGGGSESSTVAGQAFFITDGQPLSYYTFARKIWYIAGDRTEKPHIRYVSFWLVIVTAWMNEIFYFIFSLGQKRPKVGTYDVKELTRGVNWSIVKARSVLGYEPSGVEEGFRRSVEGAIYEEEMRRLVREGGGG